MAQRCDILYRLQHDGTSQAQRPLAALDPAYVKVDERDIEDFLVFALRFARQLIYYHRQNQDAGDWKDFFAGDISVLIAAIQKTNPLIIKRAVVEALKMEKTPAPAKEQAWLEEQLKSLHRLFSLLIDLARKIDTWKRSLPSSSLLKDQVSKLIRANLAQDNQTGVLHQVAEYERKVADFFPDYEPIDITVRYAAFSDEWKLDLSAITPDDSVFGTATKDVARIWTAKEKLGELFVRLYNVLIEIIRRAPAYFDDSLKDRSDHEPHLALFIAFLKLFLNVRNHANKLTEQHLDFFYKDVLRLKTRSAVPDDVHVSFQLARQKDEYKLDAGTALDAGKDNTGFERVYTLADDLVANRAQISSLRTVFVASKEDTSDASAPPTITGVYAAPVANSQDGKGKKIEAATPSWKTLGSTMMPEASFGFALASPELALAEGKRIITVIIAFSKPLAQAQQPRLQGAFAIQLSGEEAWIKIKPDDVTVTVDAQGRLQLQCTLQATDEAVVNFDATALKEQYGTTLPLMKVLVQKPAGTAQDAAHPYHRLKGCVVSSITLKTEAAGARTLAVQNDLAVLDATKSFSPFGPLPTVGSCFYVGSTEAFRKHLQTLTVHMAWENVPANFATHYQGYQQSASWPDRQTYMAKVSVLNPRAASATPKPALQRPLFLSSLMGGGTVDPTVEGTDPQTVRVYMQLPGFRAF